MTDITIRTPTPLNLQQQRINAGDTVEFLEKMTATQSKLEVFSGEIVNFISDLNEAVQIIDTIAASAADDSANAVLANLQQIRDQIQQSTSNAESTLASIQESSDAAMEAISLGRTQVLNDISTLSQSEQGNISTLSSQRISEMEQLAQTATEAADAAVNASDYYSRSETDTALGFKADKANTHTKTETDNALGLKADKANTYTKTETDTALGLKADKAETYTKNETDTALGFKSDKSDTYTKAEVDTALGGKAASSHNHDASQITSGIFSSSRLPSATSSQKGAVRVFVSGTTGYIYTS